MSDASSPAPPHPEAARRPSAARARLLSAASRLFYAEGVHSVGVDRVISEAQITRATFYRHFPGKEDLVVEYLRTHDQRRRSQVAEFTEGGDPTQALAAIVEDVGRELTAADFRGCPYINVAAEYPDPSSPVRRVVEEHRAWFQGTIARLLEAAGHPDPQYAADLLVALRDGAQVAAYLGDASTARTNFLRSAAAVFG